jgi:alcohol dehydrogenase (cytochrome c)
MLAHQWHAICVTGCALIPEPHPAGLAGCWPRCDHNDSGDNHEETLGFEEPTGIDRHRGGCRDRLESRPGGCRRGYPAVTYQRLTDAQRDPGWLTYYRTYNGQAHSPLKQIDASNVKQLTQAWSYKFPAELKQGFEATPIVNGRYLFVTTPKDNVYAFDATTGAQLWKYEPKLGAESFKTACCDVVNRGVALYGKNVYVAMLSGEVAALDAQTGALVWKKQMFEPGLGYAFSLAPLAIDGAIVVGSSGGEYGARGFIAALSPNDGSVLWKRYTIPARARSTPTRGPTGCRRTAARRRG